MTLNQTFQSIGTHSVIIRHLLVAENSSSIDNVTPKLPLTRLVLIIWKLSPLCRQQTNKGLATGSTIFWRQNVAVIECAHDRNDYACTHARTCLPGSYVSAEKTETSDRVCSHCEHGKFSASNNSQSCKRFSMYSWHCYTKCIK